MCLTSVLGGPIRKNVLLSASTRCSRLDRTVIVMFRRIEARTVCASTQASVWTMNSVRTVVFIY